MVLLTRKDSPGCSIPRMFNAKYWQRLLAVLFLNILWIPQAASQEYCDDTVPPIAFDAWAVTTASGVPMEVAYIRVRSLEELRSRVEEATYRQVYGAGYQSHSMTRVHLQDGQTRWDWQSVTADGQLIQSTSNSQTVVNHAGGQPRCPDGYRHKAVGSAGQFVCTLINENLRHCPLKEKPDKERDPCGRKVGNPCNVATGNKLQTERDYERPGSLLRFSRYYNSDLSTPRGSIGPQWRGEFDSKLFFGTHMLYRTAQTTGVQIFAHRSEGRVVAFKLDESTNTFVPRDPDSKERLSQIDITTWELLTDDNAIETYKAAEDGAAILVRINRKGYIQTLTYNSNGTVASVVDSYGRRLSFTYDSSKRLISLRDPEQSVYRYKYNSAGYLSRVIRPGGTSVQYRYGDNRHAGALTAIVDENGTNYAKYAYDSSRRAILSEHAGGAQRVTLAPSGTGTTVTDALGNSEEYSFQVAQSVRKVSGVASAGSAVNAAFDANGNLINQTDRNGIQTLYTYDSRGLETSRTEANGTPRERVTTTQWHSKFRLPIQIDQPGRRTVFIYDVNGNVLEKAIVDTATGEQRRFAQTFSPLGQLLTIDGPRTDVNDVSSYTYYACTTGYQCGQVHTATNALGYVTTYLTYNAHGQPLTSRDHNGLLVSITYDQLGRPTSHSSGSETSLLEYWPTGLLKKLTLPDGQYVVYSYDDAHRLTSIVDDEGNSITYTLDQIGNRTKEEVRDPDGLLTASRGKVFDTLKRLVADIGADGTTAVTTSFGYDENGNLVEVDAPLGRGKTQEYDELNRLVAVNDALGGEARYQYNALDQLISVTDPRNNVTSYMYDAFDQVKQLNSGDTGQTSYVYDAAGNVVSKTDARGITATYAYDGLNRVIQTVLPDQTVSYGYDQGPYGSGRQTSIVDNSGQTSWEYDERGNVTRKSQNVAGMSKEVSYSFDSAGRRTSVTLPSGQQVIYGYTRNKVTSISVNGTVLILNGVLYEPFGPIRGWSWGNGTVVSRGHDKDGNVAYVESAGLRSYSYDAASRIVGEERAADTPALVEYGYDLQDRVISASSGGVSDTWMYDANGNITARGGSTSISWAVSASSNRLLGSTGDVVRSYTLDAVGNIVNDGARSFSFDSAGRMTAASSNGVTTAYAINALGQRVRKASTSGTRYFVYDEDSRLIGEYGESGELIQEIVWLEDIPVASIRPDAVGSGVGVFYIHVDHLNVPTKLTRTTDNVVVWRWERDAFGVGAPNEDPDGNGLVVNFNLRFPGQYYDAETGLHHNRFRDYDPQSGRYLQSDPLGLAAGFTTYGYADGNPVQVIDPSGLFPICETVRKSTSKRTYTEKVFKGAFRSPPLIHMYPKAPNVGGEESLRIPKKPPIGTEVQYDIYLVYLVYGKDVTTTYVQFVDHMVSFCKSKSVDECGREYFRVLEPTYYDVVHDPIKTGVTESDSYLFTETVRKLGET